ncbi:MAG: hypothetical protein D6678_01280 [Zetaproteobacteria bacterium]|nr:MAG: hypothetical protein D6678_01280 [Zetaproteobacteria bacterium]
MKKHEQASPNLTPNEMSASELEELKRDMRSAQIAAWIEQHRQRLLIGGVVLALALVAGGYWQQQARERAAAASLMYTQALQQRDSTKRQDMLRKLVEAFPSSPQAAMAQMQLAALDDAHLEQHLQAVIAHDKSMDMWRWQARLDLADWYRLHGRKNDARALLQERMGKAYEQRRHYLLALLAEDVKERSEHLQKAQAAESYDNELKREIERLLAGEGRKS